MQTAKEFEMQINQAESDKEVRLNGKVYWEVKTGNTFTIGRNCMKGVISISRSGVVIDGSNAEIEAEIEDSTGSDWGLFFIQPSARNVTLKNFTLRIRLHNPEHSTRIFSAIYNTAFGLKIENCSIEIYGLICGLEIYFFEEAFLPQSLMSFLREKKIEVFNTTPTVWLTLLKYSSIKSFPVKVSAISGERLTEKSTKEIAEAFPETEFYNVYGLTEHSPRACALMPEDFVRKAGSIGKPLGNVYAKIEEGELLLKSPSVMKGYFKDEEKSKKKIKNGWLYTGDMAYKDEEG